MNRKVRVVFFLCEVFLVLAAVRLGNAGYFYAGALLGVATLSVVHAFERIRFRAGVRRPIR